jgi:hypothetical protein
MASLRDFPPLDICRPCKRIFVNFEDPRNNSENSHDDSTIQIQMLTRDGLGGYEFTRIRKDVEVAAIWGCVFCRAIISGDRGYLKKDVENENENVEEDEKQEDEGVISGEEDAGASESGDDEVDSNDSDYESSTDDEDDEPTKSWDPPWDDACASMMVYNPDGKGNRPRPEWFPPRPEWFPPLDEELQLKMKYNYMYNELSIGASGDRDPSYHPRWGLFTTEG